MAHIKASGALRCQIESIREATGRRRQAAADGCSGTPAAHRRRPPASLQTYLTVGGISRDPILSDQPLKSGLASCLYPAPAAEKHSKTGPSTPKTALLHRGGRFVWCSLAVFLTVPGRCQCASPSARSRSRRISTRSGRSTRAWKSSSVARLLSHGGPRRITLGHGRFRNVRLPPCHVLNGALFQMHAFNPAHSICAAR